MLTVNNIVLTVVVRLAWFLMVWPCYLATTILALALKEQQPISLTLQVPRLCDEGVESVFEMLPGIPSLRHREKESA